MEFPLPFTLTALLVFIACLLTKLQDSNTYLIGALHALFGPLEVLTIAWTIYYEYINTTTYSFLVIIIIGSSLSFIYLLNFISFCVQTHYLYNDVKFKAWVSSKTNPTSTLNKCFFNFISLLSVLISFKLKSIVFTRLFSCNCMNCKLENVQRFRIFNIFSFIGVIPEGTVICFLAMTFTEVSKTQEILLFVDTIVIVSICIILAIWSARKNDDFFCQVVEGFHLNKVSNLECDYVQDMSTIILNQYGNVGSTTKLEDIVEVIEGNEETDPKRKLIKSRNSKSQECKKELTESRTSDANECYESSSGTAVDKKAISSVVGITIVPEIEVSPCHSTDGSRLKREKPELGPLSQEADIERIVSEFGSDSDAKKIQYSINSRITEEEEISNERNNAQVLEPGKLEQDEEQRRKDELQSLKSVVKKSHNPRKIPIEPADQSDSVLIKFNTPLRTNSQTLSEIKLLNYSYEESVNPVPADSHSSVPQKPHPSEEKLGDGKKVEIRKLSYKSNHNIIKLEPDNELELSKFRMNVLDAEVNISEEFEKYRNKELKGSRDREILPRKSRQNSESVLKTKKIDGIEELK